MSGEEFAGPSDSPSYRLAPAPSPPGLIVPPLPPPPVRRQTRVSRVVGLGTRLDPEPSPVSRLAPAPLSPILVERARSPLFNPTPEQILAMRSTNVGVRESGPRLVPRPMLVGERSTDPTMRPTFLRYTPGSERHLFPTGRVQVTYYYVYNSSAREMPVPSNVDRLNDDLGVLEYIPGDENYINSLRDIPLPKIDIPHQVETHFTAELHESTPRRLYYFRSIGNRYEFTRIEKLKALIYAVVMTRPQEDVWTNLLRPPRGFEDSQVLYGTKTSGHPRDLRSGWSDGDFSKSVYITKKLRRFAGRLIIKISKAE